MKLSDEMYSCKSHVLWNLWCAEFRESVLIIFYCDELFLMFNLDERMMFFSSLLEEQHSFSSFYQQLIAHVYT